MNQTNKSHKQRWYRSSDGIIAGVCQGLAEKLDIEAWLMRVIWLVAVCFFGVGLLFYIILAVLLPRQEKLNEPDQKMLLGVCLALSKKLDIPLEIVRVITVLIALGSGISLLVYVILYFVFAKEQEKKDEQPQVIDLN